MNYLKIFLLVAIVCASCDTTNQYDVYIVNHTGSEMKVSFKTLIDTRGVYEDQIILKPEERQKIISTINVEKDEPSQPPSNAQCGKVLEYLEAMIFDSLSNNTKWCSDDVEVAHVDIGQGEFVVEYKLEDFQ